jgi:hypothetical protein
MRPTRPDGEPIAFSAPKETYRAGDEYRVVIDAHDVNWVSPQEAAADPLVWSALTWGGRRDLELVRRLGSDFDTLADAVASEAWESREGFIRGAKRAHECSDRLGLRILEDHELWAECSLLEYASRFPENHNPMFERPREVETYRLPLLLTKESWTVSAGRFRGVVVTPTARIKVLLFSQSFMGVQAPQERDLAALALVINSSLAVHYFYLTSGRLASYRPTLRKVDLEQIPLPQSRNITLEQLASMGEGDLDAAAYDLFELNDVERVLVEDFLHVTLEDFKGHAGSPGRAPLTAAEQDRELRDYCKWFIEVLQAGFGADKCIAGKLHIPTGKRIPPYCIVSFHFDMPHSTERVQAARLDAEQLRELLRRVGGLLATQRPEVGGVFYQRVARVYVAQKGESEDEAVPMLFIIKPNARRYWTRSIAVRDADEVAADILQSNLVSTE